MFVPVELEIRLFWPEHLLHFFLKPTMLREVRNFPSLTLCLVSLQHVRNNKLHVGYAAVLRTQPSGSSSPMSADCRAAHTIQKCLKNGANLVEGRHIPLSISFLVILIIRELLSRMKKQTAVSLNYSLSSLSIFRKFYYQIRNCKDFQCPF